MVCHAGAMPTGLFGRIACHPVGVGRNEHEDRLTEVLAAVIDHHECPDLAQFLVSRWIQLELDSEHHVPGAELRELRDRLQDGDWDCEVKTQTWVAVDGGWRRPDLLLLFSRVGERGIAVCVEVKDGTRPHTNQLHAYATWLSELHAAQNLVVLVAPRASYPFPQDQVPDDVPQVSWQQTTRILRDYRDDRERSDAAELLIAELLLYLKEEGLMPIDRVTPEHLVAIAHHKEAFDALEEVYAAADAFVWNARGGAPPPDHHKTYGQEGPGLQYWWHHTWPSEASGPIADWFLGWAVFRDSSRAFYDGRPGVPRIAAGASAVRDAAGTLGELAPATKDRLAKDRFHLLGQDDMKVSKRERIWRFTYPEDVIQGSSLEEQGAAVGRWVNDAFEKVHTILAG
jgi:hypothetical protein